MSEAPLYGLSPTLFLTTGTTNPPAGTNWPIFLLWRLSEKKDCFPQESESKTNRFGPAARVGGQVDGVTPAPRVPAPAGLETIRVPRYRQSDTVFIALLGGLVFEAHRLLYHSA